MEADRVLSPVIIFGFLDFFSGTFLPRRVGSGFGPAFFLLSFTFSLTRLGITFNKGGCREKKRLVLDPKNPVWGVVGV